MSTARSWVWWFRSPLLPFPTPQSGKNDLLINVHHCVEYFWEVRRLLRPTKIQSVRPLLPIITPDEKKGSGPGGPNRGLTTSEWYAPPYLAYGLQAFLWPWLWLALLLYTPHRINPLGNGLTQESEGLAREWNFSNHWNAFVSSCHLFNQGLTPKAQFVETCVLIIRLAIRSLPAGIAPPGMTIASFRGAIQVL